MAESVVCSGVELAFVGNADIYMCDGERLIQLSFGFG